MNVKIKNLDALIDSKKVTVAGYTIDLFDLPISVTLKMNAMLSELNTVTEESILYNVIIPIIKRCEPNKSEQDIIDSLNQKQVILLWRELVESLYSTGAKDDDTIKDDKVKKK